HRARARVGAVTDRDGRDEGVVRAGAYVRADRRVVLVDAVEVHEHRRGPDVRALPDRRVADVGQVRDLRALADRDVLRLDEGADLAARGEPRPGAQVGERADQG